MNIVSYTFLPPVENDSVVIQLLGIVVGGGQGSGLPVVLLEGSVHDSAERMSVQVGKFHVGGLAHTGQKNEKPGQGLG